jgi:uncharacterized protein YbjQ (UPF0145 family)
MIISTTPAIEGFPVVKYLGVVAGEAILGVNIMRDFVASLKDIVGGRAETYEVELRRGRETALREMSAAAQALGANAIVGVDFDYEYISLSVGMLMVTASGTAVKVKE